MTVFPAQAGKDSPKMRGWASGRVFMRNDEPVPRIVVRARSANEPVSWALTDEEGRFEIAVSRTGGTELALGPQYAQSAQPSGTPRLLLGSLSAVRAGSRDLVIWASVVAADRTLRVRITAPDGTAVPRASVLVRPCASVRTVVTDATGRVEVVGLPRETVVVAVVLGPRHPAHGRWLPPRPQEVVPAGQELSLALRPGTPVEGVVLLRDGGPAQSASVTAFDGATSVAFALTDARGHFKLLLEPDQKGPLRITAVPFSKDGVTIRQSALWGVAPGSTGLELRVDTLR